MDITDAVIKANETVNSILKTVCTEDDYDHESCRSCDHGEIRIQAVDADIVAVRFSLLFLVYSGVVVFQSSGAIPLSRILLWNPVVVDGPS